ncbi:scoloptoxin SSD14-like isoform X2 [Schistocerca gregaria]|uniref:scoloptoxin SSD14-like isoform X2 n=1 Tax=Schistocerca gregaria TaxID=7010 RepID=UPI00211DC008|nr:scoloptoxin SSD14-like isoform X2 [Schistocerca gregaria]
MGSRVNIQYERLNTDDRRAPSASRKLPKLIPLPECRPKLRRQLVVFVGVVVLGALALAIVHVCYQLAARHGGATVVLVPPNPEVPQAPSPSTLHRFSKAAVCSDAAPCSSIGRDILMKNGSVVDAAIATLFCNGVVNCQSMGLGGGFLMTLYVNKTAVTLNARETAPSQVREELYDDESKSQIGALAVGVPGELKGYWEAYKRYGKLPWSDLVAPAIAVCESGYNMTRHQADSLFFNAAAVKSDPTLREIFIDPATGKFYSEGTLIKHNKLCETLKVISKEGGDALYTGSLAEKLAADIQARGGIITVDDLKNYRAVWESPVTAELHGKHTLYSVPPPGSGILLAFILNILNGYNFTASSVSDLNQTITTYHRTVEAFKYAYARRTELGDPHFLNISQVVNMLQSKEYAETVRRKINDTQTYQDPKHYGAVFYNKDDHGTAHISIIGPNGDAVSVTSTVNIYFGAGVVSKQTGIILNSVMDDFSFSKYKNYFGLPGSPANAVKPWKRPLSSMCPSVIVDENKNVKLVIGASGGTKITTAVATVIMRYLWFGDNIKEAVDASRIHHQLYPMKLSYEYGVLDQVIKGLEKLGHLTDRYKSRGSIICAIAKEAEYIFANADYRKRGDVFGID